MRWCEAMKSRTKIPQAETSQLADGQQLSSHSRINVSAPTDADSCAVACDDAMRSTLPSILTPTVSTTTPLRLSSRAHRIDDDHEQPSCLPNPSATINCSSHFSGVITWNLSRRFLNGWFGRLLPDGNKSCIPLKFLFSLQILKENSGDNPFKLREIILWALFKNMTVVCDFANGSIS